MQVHHVACTVIFEMDVAAQICRQEEMVHGVFGGEEGRGHIVETVFDLDLQVRIGQQRLDQVAGDIRGAGKKPDEPGPRCFQSQLPPTSPLRLRRFSRS